MMRRLSTLLFVCLLASSGTASATLEDIEWSVILGEIPGQGAVGFEGAGGGITATVNFLIIQGDMSVRLQPLTDPAFIEQFGDGMSTLNYITQVAPPGGANIASTILFSAPLPAGSRIVVVDVDFRGETVTLIGGADPLVLLDQVETQAGAGSSFPQWAAPNLVEDHPNDLGNDIEASIFDGSGLTSLDVGFTMGEGSGIGVAVFVPPLARQIPAVGTAGTIALAIVFVLLALGTGAAARFSVAARSRSRR